MARRRTSRWSHGAEIFCATAVLAAAFLTACGRKAEEEAAPVVTVDVAPVPQSPIQRTIRAEGVLYRQQAAIVPKISARSKTLCAAWRTGSRGSVALELENQDPPVRRRKAARLRPSRRRRSRQRPGRRFRRSQQAELDLRAAKDLLDARRRALRTARISTRKARSLRKTPTRLRRISARHAVSMRRRKNVSRSSGIRSRPGDQSGNSPTRRCQGSQ